ncbi:glycosyltransferase [Citrobacter farmeri]|uniref:glycosyltransferase n=1 Tax=Citrobacter farmeri TaxID=67824 RepID=UPI00388D76E9|nr:glycosyltransferase family 4 protein [Citrobacter farmeri]
MSARSGLAKVFHNIINIASYYIVNKSDGVALITSQMAERFEPKLKHVVIEGITSPFNHSMGCHSDWWPEFLVRKKYFLYTGTLDKRYGIRDLICSYLSADVRDILLVICGDGDDRTYVETMSLHNENIKYMGQLEHSKIKILQKNSALLINPRSNEGEFTKYSFPSKVIEYMNAGVPILMYRLDGIPESYQNFFYHIESKDDFVKKLKIISAMNDEELQLMGNKAKEFVIEHASPIKQVGKLISLFSQ